MNAASRVSSGWPSQYARVADLDLMATPVAQGVVSMIKQTLKNAAVAAGALATLGGATLTTAAPAEAYPVHGGYGGHGGGYGYGWRGGYGGYGYGWRPGVAIGAGILGVAIGASLAQPYYGPPPAYYAGPGYWGYDGGCHSYWRWNPGWGRYARVDRCY
jgi:hypothetical protein